jgi:hypothetical protein|tara:strand:+ start:85 stop:315 length:231 start_codon:yes stop_codon:yes gene_type:complete
MIENMNKLLEHNEVLVRCYTEWYRLESISITDDGKMPIIVSDEDGEEHEFDMADIEEFDPVFEGFRDMDTINVGVA